MKSHNYWLKFGCFLTGYNYQIIRDCSELAAKRVKRFTSAMLIISTLWAFVGYTFSSRYLKTDWYISLIGATVTVLIVIQIERIIILSPKGNKIPMIARFIIGLGMALIGSVVIDQILFKEDIEKEKHFTDQLKIEALFKSESSELRRQIQAVDSSIRTKEAERHSLNDDISKRPVQTYYTRQKTLQKAPGDSIPSEVITTTATQLANPKIDLLKSVDDQIQKLIEQRRMKEAQLLDLRPTVEKKIKANSGFLDELEVLFNLLLRSEKAMTVWILWIVILVGLESLVLLGKLGEKETDYDTRLEHQMQLHHRRIELMFKQ